MNNENTIPSLEKALQLMEFLGGTTEGATQQELVRQIGLTTSTCYRVLQTLKNRDWVKQNAGGRYDLAAGILRTSMKLYDQVPRVEHMQPLLEQLSHQTGLSCKLSVRQGDDQLTLLRAESPNPVSVSGKVGAKFPIIEGSVGAALLFLTESDSIEQLAKSCKDDIPEKNNPALVLKRIDEIRQTGVCLGDSESRWRVSAMSAPVVSADGCVIAALTLLGFTEDFAGKKETLALQLQETASTCMKCH